MSDRRLGSCGAGLGVVSVSFAVVPAEELEVVEVGFAVVGWAPVLFVVGLAAVGGLFASGGLAVTVANDEGFPLGGGGGAGGAADVEDFGCAGHDDAGEVAVAHDPVERRSGQAPGVSRSSFAR
jgi:hypothetical protein